MQFHVPFEVHQRHFERADSAALCLRLLLLVFLFLLSNTPCLGFLTRSLFSQPLITLSRFFVSIETIDSGEVERAALAGERAFVRGIVQDFMIGESLKRYDFHLTFSSLPLSMAALLRTDHR